MGKVRGRSFSQMSDDSVWHGMMIERAHVMAGKEMTLEMRDEPAEVVDSPSWYTSGEVETIEKIEAVVDGLPAVQAYALGQVLRYFDRAGRKDATDTDLGKANNYAHRLVYGEWRGIDE